MGRRHAGQPAEAPDQRIADEILQVLQAASADVQQRQDQQAEAPATIVAPDGRARCTQPVRQRNPPQVPLQQFQAAVGRQLLGHERDRQISLDHLPQGAYAQAHQRGLRGSKSDVGTSALLIRGDAPLMHFRCRSIPFLFSGWG
jgi:hypothetical protein